MPRHVSCDNGPSDPDALDISPEQIKSSYDAITASRPEVQAALKQLGFNSINDMKPNVFYTILADGEIVQTLPLDKNNIKSVRLLEKNNFKQEPVPEIDKDFLDGVYYVLLNPSV